MKQYFPLTFFLFLLVSCDKNSDNNIRKEVLSIAENYVTGNLNDTTKIILDNGTIIIGDDQKTYVIDPEKIFIGFIDQDKKEDAIISLLPYQGNIEVTTEHLFIINTSGQLILIRALETDMRILDIKDGTITAEIPEHTRNSPLFDCASCWEVVEYRFVNGELVWVE